VQTEFFDVWNPFRVLVVGIDVVTRVRRHSIVRRPTVVRILIHVVAQRFLVVGEVATHRPCVLGTRPRMGDFVLGDLASLEFRVQVKDVDTLRVRHAPSAVGISLAWGLGNRDLICVVPPLMLGFVIPATIGLAKSDALSELGCIEVGFAATNQRVGEAFVYLAPDLQWEVEEVRKR
jgi:hypothetical protein